PQLAPSPRSLGRRSGTGAPPPQRHVHLAAPPRGVGPAPVRPPFGLPPPEGLRRPSAASKRCHLDPQRRNSGMPWKTQEPPRVPGQVVEPDPLPRQRLRRPHRRLRRGVPLAQARPRGRVLLRARGGAPPRPRGPDGPAEAPRGDPRPPRRPPPDASPAARRGP